MAEANAVSLKLPTFWAQEPNTWFIQAEAQFNIRNITADETKYHYIVASLDQQTASRIRNLLQNPPQDDKYGALKARLLKTFSQSETQRANQLIDLPDLGDETPSMLMDKMLALLGDHNPCFLFRQLFLRRLPEDIRTILVHSKIEDARDLAEAADGLWHTRNSNAQTMAVQRKKNKHFTHDQVTKNPDWCYFHNLYKEKARTCKPPCSFQSREQGNDQAGRQ